MRTPHHCYQCGTDLTRLRARIDDGLRLALVHCPACARVQVRRPIRAPRTLRRVRRAIAAVLLLGLQAGLLAGATAMSVGAATVLEEAVRDLFAGRATRFEDLFEGLPSAHYFSLLIPGAMFGIAGLWHGLSFAHLRAARAFVGFSVWVIACTQVVELIEVVDREAHPWQALESDWVASVAMGLVAGAPAFLATMALGRAARRSGEARRRLRFRTLLGLRRGR